MEFRHFPTYPIRRGRRTEPPRPETAVPDAIDRRRPRGTRGNWRRALEHTSRTDFWRVVAMLLLKLPVSVAALLLGAVPVAQCPADLDHPRQGSASVGKLGDPEADRKIGRHRDAETVEDRRRANA